MLDLLQRNGRIREGSSPIKGSKRVLPSELFQALDKQGYSF